MFKLRDWPFKQGELSTVRWMKSPYSNEKNEWILPVVFEGESKKIAQVDTLWGSILLLRYGQIYQDGRPFEVCREGCGLTLEIEDSSQGNFCKASELDGFLPDGIYNIDSENCWTFENKGIKVFIPCIEIVRSFLTPNKTMANALLTPYGLDDIANCKIHSDEIFIKFNGTVPKQVANLSLAKYLAWIKSNQLVNEAWSSVYRELFPKGAINEMFMAPLFDYSGQPLVVDDKRIKVKFPVAGPCKLQARALLGSDKIFVSEIQRVGELSLPFAKVFFTHSSFKAKKDTRVDIPNRFIRKARRRKKDRGERELVNVSPTTLSKTVILNTAPTVLVFGGKIVTSKISNVVPRYRRELTNKDRQMSKKERREAEIRAQEKLRGQNLPKDEEENTLENLFSTGEIFFDGEKELFPIEVRGMDVVNAAFSNGFEAFFKMLSILEILDNSLKVGEPKIMQLPGGKGFARKKEDGTPRQCVLVPVHFKSPPHREFYILEVERSPKMCLSTLLIWPREEKSFTEKTLNILIEKLLRNLLRNNGHWEKDDIRNHPQAKIITIKHWNEWTPLDWAEVLLEKIGV